MTDPFERPARPWDIFNKNIEKLQGPIAKGRLDICMSCPELISVTHQCKICKCFMDVKTKLPNASCPLGKWGQIKVSIKEEVKND